MPHKLAEDEEKGKEVTTGIFFARRNVILMSPK